MAATTTKRTAIDAYVANHAAAADLLAEITEALEECHGVGPDEINWGHVGDVGYVVEQLEEIKRFIASGSAV